MRLIMLGTGPFAVPTLEKLAASRHEIALVITRPPTGRNATASPLQRAGESLNLEVWSPATVNAPESQSQIASLAPDLLVVCDYGEILRPETLATARLGGINLHGSLLPKYRGAAPVQWAILNGEAETGNSVIQMTPGLDAGPLLAQQRTPIDPDEDAEQLEARLAAMGAEAVLESSTSWNPAQPNQSHKTKAWPRKRRASRRNKAPLTGRGPRRKSKTRSARLRPWPRAFTFWHRSGANPLRVNIDRVAIRSRRPYCPAPPPLPARSWMPPDDSSSLPARVQSKSSSFNRPASGRCPPPNFSAVIAQL